MKHSGVAAQRSPVPGGQFEHFFLFVWKHEIVIVLCYNFSLVCDLRHIFAELEGVRFVMILSNSETSFAEIF